jgi:hypothetical protein
MDSNNDNKSTLLTIGILLGFAAIIHIPFHFGSLYGEQDTARLVNDALIWMKTGLRTEGLSEYRFYICPGYIWLSKQAVHISQATSVHPAFYLNTLNLLVIILIVAPIFLLFKRLVGHESAFLGTILLSVIPTFWQSGLYGFPHLLSLFFMIFALLFYDRHLTDQTIKVTDLLLIELMLIISILLKADIYLSAVAFLGLIIYRGRFSRRYLLITAALLILPVIISAVISKSLLASSPNTVEYMAQWTTQYNISLRKLFSISAIGGVVMSMGFLSGPVFVASLLFLIYKKQYSLVLLLTLWTAVPLAFWVSRTGDSSRHHLQASLPVALGIGALLGSMAWKASWRYAALIALILANYFCFRPTSSTIATSGNLAGSSHLIRERISYYHRVAERYADVDANKKVILGTFTNPYIDNEVLYRAQTVESVRRYKPFGYDAIEIHYTSNGKQYVSSSVRLRPEEVVAATSLYQNAGYKVYSMEYDALGNLKSSVTDLEEFYKSG